MIKKNFKTLAILFVILTVISSFSLCFADETANEVTATTETATEQTAEEAETNQEIHNGDLYLFDSNVKMDKLVDGNVYIMGNNVEITGQVNGNLFVLANKVSFGTKAQYDAEGKETAKAESCYVRYSIFAAAQEIYYNGACNDLYAACEKLEMTYDSYVIRDVKAAANTTNFKAAIGRDVDLQTNTLNLGQDDQAPIIYGNFRYSASQEQEIKEGVVTGEVTYKANKVTTDSKSVGETIKDIVITFLAVIATALVINLILVKFAPDFAKDMAKNISVGSIVITCLKGLAVLAAGAVVAILLFVTEIGAKLGFVVILSLILIGLFATPISAIYIANALKSVIKSEKTVMHYLIIALVAVILQGITYIPFFGGLISIIVFLLGYGLMVTVVWPNKVISDEEKQEKIAKKEAAKALKAEKKAEKKAAKKENKE